MIQILLYAYLVCQMFGNICNFKCFFLFLGKSKKFEQIVLEEAYSHGRSRQGSQANPDLNIEFSTDSTRTDHQASRNIFCMKL